MSDSLMQDAKTVIYGQHQPELLDLVVLGPDRKPLKRVAIDAALSVGQSNGDLKVERGAGRYLARGAGEYL